jgi:hypothetical protein
MTLILLLFFLSDRGSYPCLAFTGGHGWAGKGMPVERSLWKPIGCRQQGWREVPADCSFDVTEG